MLGVPMAEEHRPHLPTARKLRQARERGEVPRSPLASATLVMLAGGAAIVLSAPAFIEAWRAFAVRALSGQGTLDEAVAVAAEALVWPLAACVVAGAAGGVLQVGPLFAAKAFAPDLARLDPGAGLRRIFAPAEMVSRVAPLLLVLLIGAIAALVIVDVLPALVGRVEATPAQALGWAATSVGALYGYACGALVVGGAIALAYRRHRFLEDQRMSRSEMRREQRDTEGEPAARRRRARRHRELAMGPSLEEASRSAKLIVRGAEVAVIVAWAGRKEAPTVAFVARRHALLRLWRLTQGVPRVSDERLANELARQTGGARVPEALYRRLAAHMARSVE